MRSPTVMVSPGGIPQPWRMPSGLLGVTHSEEGTKNVKLKPEVEIRKQKGR